MRIPDAFRSGEPATVPTRHVSHGDITSPHRPPHEDMEPGICQERGPWSTEAPRASTNVSLVKPDDATVAQPTVHTAEQIWQARFGFAPRPHDHTHFAYFLRLLRHFQRPGVADIMINRFLRDRASDTAIHQPDRRWLRKRHGDQPLQNMYDAQQRASEDTIQNIRGFITSLSTYDVDQLTLQDLTECYDRLNWLLPFAVDHPAQATITPGFFNWFTQRVADHQRTSWDWLRHFRH